MLLIISLLGSKKNFFVENEWEKKQEKNEYCPWCLDAMHVHLPEQRGMQCSDDVLITSVQAPILPLAV